MKIYELGEIRRFFDYFDNYDEFMEALYQYMNVADAGSSMDALDVGYYDLHSRDKNVTPNIERIIKESSNPEATLGQLYIYAYSKFRESWKRVLDALMTSYKPLENYSMLEQENVASKITSTSESNAGLYGFNSSESSPVSDSSSTMVSSGSADDNERILTRSGNIGVTTSQQMLQSEIELRRFDFIERIYNDLDSVFASSIY